MESGFAWTIPLIQFVFGALFLAVYRAGAARTARSWGIAYLLNAGAFAASLGAAIVADQVATIAADTLFALSIFVFSEALIQRYGLPRMLAVRVPVLVVSIIVPTMGTIAGNLHFEVLTCDLGYAVQLAIPLLMIRRADRFRDRLIVGCSWFVALVNVVRLASAPTADGTNFTSFLATAYSYLMFADGMVSGMTFGAVALASVTAELLDRYRREADIDPLTGLLNRRGLELAAKPTQMAGRECLLVCDLDHFKRVNDSCGHATGDAVLAAFGRILSAVTPSGSVAARTGGEEFAVFLPDHALHGGEAVAVRLQQALAAHDWCADGIGWRQTASIGLIAQPGGLSLGELLRVADTHLYDAKRNGRDRISSPRSAICSAMAG